MAGSEGRCAECESSKTAVPLATVEGTTLWWCAREDCPASTWQAPATDTERSAETADPEDALDRLLDIASRRSNPAVLQAAHALRDFYAAADVSMPEIDWTMRESQLAD